MLNIKQLNKTYIEFNNVGELETILKVFSKFGFSYKNGSLDSAINLANATVVNKIICHDNFVMTSAPKVTTISYKVFMTLVESFTNEKDILNNNKKDTMRNSASKLNTLKAARVFKDEEKLEAIIKVSDDAQEIAENFIGALNKAEDKANKVCSLVNAYEDAVESEDMKELARIGDLIESSIEYITKGNKVLAALNSAGHGVVKADSKAEDKTGKTYIGE